VILFSETNDASIKLTKFAHENDLFPPVTSLNGADPTNLPFMGLLSVVLHFEYPIVGLLAR
jgi:hypothetical protein